MNSAKMLFVVGNSRSGTTMMGRIVGNHPAVFTFGELHFFGQLWSPAVSVNLNQSDAETLAAKLFCIQREGYRTHGNAQSFEQDARTFCETLTNYPIDPAELYSEFLSYETSLHGKTIPCDQTPRNVFYIDEILKYYPNAKIINMVRDPRDVLLSQKRKWKRRFLGGSDMPIKESLRDWINYHPITINKIWHTAVSTADRYADHERIITIYFEKLLEDSEATVSRLCNFVDIEYDKSLLQVPQVGSSVNTDKPGQLGINPDRAGNWNESEKNISNLSSSEIYISQKLNGTLMQKHNYTPISIRPNVFSLTINILSFPIKLALAFLCNLDRIKNIRETLKRRL